MQGSSVVVREKDREVKMAANENWYKCLKTGNISEIKSFKTKRATQGDQSSVQSETKSPHTINENFEDVRQQPIGQSEDITQRSIGQNHDVPHDVTQEPIGQDVDIEQKLIVQDEGVKQHPIGQNEVTQQAISQSYLKQEPIGQDDAREQPVGQNDVRQQPIGQDDVRLQPIGQNEVTQQAISQSHLKQEPIGQDDVRQHPIGQNGENSTSNTSIPCNICQTSYKNVHLYIRHLRMFHNSRKVAKVPCDICHCAPFSSQSKLNEHRRIVHGLVDGQATDISSQNISTHGEMYSCPLCNKAFFLKTSLEKHLENHPVVSVEPEVQPKQENSFTSEENAITNSDNNKNNSQPINFMDIKEDLDSTNGDRLDLHQSSEKDSNTAIEINGKFEETGYSREPIESAPMPPEECNLVESTLDEKMVSDGEEDITSEPSAPSNLIFDMKEETRVEANDLVTAGTLPKILEIRPMENLEVIYKCSLCPEAFALKSDLSKHFKLEHQILFQTAGNNRQFHGENGASTLSGSRSRFTCNICNAVFVRQQSLNLHKKSHPENCYKCNLCQKFFVTKRSLSYHKRWHSKVQNSWKCGKCSRSFFSKHNLERHVKLSHEETKQRFQSKHRVDRGLVDLKCSNSGEKISSRDALSNHIAIHPDCKPYVCRICQAPFRYSGNLRVHEEKHLTKRMKCPRCDEWFSTWKEVRGHKRRQHGDVAPIPCTHKCQVCGKSYRTHEELDAHSLTHLERTKTKPEVKEDKPFLCDFCSAR